MSRLQRDPQVEALVAAYRAALEDAGQYSGKEVTSPARSFLLRVDVEGWAGLSLAEQLATSGHDRRLVTWLIVTGRLRPSPGYLVASGVRVGQVAAWVYREFHQRFVATAAALGFDQKSAQLQWSAVAKVAALAGVAPERLTKAQLDAGRDQLVAATRRRHPDHPLRARPLTTRLFGAEATLFHTGVIEVPPRKRHWDKSAERAREWAAVAPRLRATLEGYIELDPFAGGVGQLELGEEGAAAGAQELVGHAADAVVEQGCLDSHQPGRALVDKRPAQAGAGAPLAHVCGWDPRLGQQALRQQRAQPARVLAVGLGAPLVAAASARLGRLGEVRDGARLTQRLANEQPARAGLDRHVDPLAREAADPAPHGLRRGLDAAAMDLAHLLVKSIEGDLRSVHVEPGYDRHWGLL